MQSSANYLTQNSLSKSFYEGMYHLRCTFYASAHAIIVGSTFYMFMLVTW